MVDALPDPPALMDTMETQAMDLAVAAQASAAAAVAFEGEPAKVELEELTGGHVGSYFNSKVWQTMGIQHLRTSWSIDRIINWGA